MLYCSYCDYHRVLPVHRGKDRIMVSICDYADCVFCGEVENVEMEYPCNRGGYEKHNASFLRPAYRNAARSAAKPIGLLFSYPPITRVKSRRKKSHSAYNKIMA